MVAFLISFFQMDKYIIYKNSFSVVLFLLLKAFLYLCGHFVPQRRCVDAVFFSQSKTDKSWYSE